MKGRGFGVVLAIQWGCCPARTAGPAASEHACNWGVAGDSVSCVERWAVEGTSRNGVPWGVRDRLCDPFLAVEGQMAGDQDHEIHRHDDRS